MPELALRTNGTTCQAQFTVEFPSLGSSLGLPLTTRFPNEKSRCGLGRPRFQAAPANTSARVQHPSSGYIQEMWRGYPGSFDMARKRSSRSARKAVLISPSVQYGTLEKLACVVGTLD